MAVPDAGGAFVGREAALSRLRRCAAEVHEGQPWVVWVEGAAGVGKSALMRRWLNDPVCEEFTVLRASADVSEQDLAWGVVGQLLTRVDAQVVEDFPLLAEGSPAASPLQVGAQLLALVGRLQAGAPVALLVDDAQWADEESLRALGFLIRRLEADQVLTVLVARAGQERLTHIRRMVTDREWSYQLTLEGLGALEVAQLAEGMLGHTVNAEAAERLWRHTHGNALYVRTLLAEFPVESLVGGRGRLPVPSSLAGAVMQQLAGLPEQTRRLVETAAVLDARSPLALVAQIGEVTDAVGALESALDAGLLRWWPNEPTTPVAVDHALQRDVVVANMAPGRRQAVHAAAAPLVDRAASWAHRVAAASGTDNELAVELEAEARLQIQAGAVERAATLLVWASDLAAARAEHERLLLIAAVQLTWADKFAQVEPLLPAVRACAPCPLRSLVLGSYAQSRGASALGEAEAELTSALTAAERCPDLRWVTAMAGFWLGWLYLPQERYEESVSTLEHVWGLPDVDENLANRVVGALCITRSCLQDPKSALDHFDQISRAAPIGQHTPAGPYMLAVRGLLRAVTGQLTSGTADLTAALRLSHASGYPAMEQHTYVHLSCAQYWLGEWDEALINADHAITFSSAENRPRTFPFAYTAASFVPSGRGDWQTAEQLLTGIRHSTELMGGRGYFAPLPAIAEAVLAQAKADHPRMLNALQPILNTPERGLAIHLRAWWRPLHAEALIGSGLFDEARQAVAALENISRSAHPHLRTVAAWLSGWLAHRRGDLKEARAHYERGLDPVPPPDEPPLHRALLEQAHGRLLTEYRGSREEATHWLRAAHRRFTALGAAPFTTRCAADLNAAGATDTAVPVGANPLARLTHREHDIAHLVSEGLTNNEIAGKLFISSKTVEYHLGHVYAKLSLANRRQLRHRIQQQNEILMNATPPTAGRAN